MLPFGSFGRGDHAIGVCSNFNLLQTPPRNIEIGANDRRLPLDSEYSQHPLNATNRNFGWSVAIYEQLQFGAHFIYKAGFWFPRLVVIREIFTRGCILHLGDVDCNIALAVFEGGAGHNNRSLRLRCGCHLGPVRKK